MNTKELLDDLYKDKLINKYLKNNEDMWKGWEKEFLRLKNLFKLNDIDLVKIFNECKVSVPCEDPYKVFYEFALNSVLPKSPLWENIIEIKKDISPLGYHGSSIDIQVINYYLIVHSKEFQLNSKNSMWVYSNYDEVSEFLNDSNKLYQSILDISKNFQVSYKND